MRIALYYIGKPRGREVNALAEDYARRIGRYARFEMRSLKSEAAAPEAAQAFEVVLDPAGKQLNSREFASLIEKTGRGMRFFVGGADGFSEGFRRRADLLLSLSPMTLPHELARVVLAEQIYRAFTILHNHPYPR